RISPRPCTRRAKSRSSACNTRRRTPKLKAWWASKFHEGSHGWQTHVIEFFAIGTAVLPLEQEIAPEKIEDPIMVVSVNDLAPYWVWRTPGFRETFGLAKELWL